jgi:hypothetical protein
MNTSPSSVPEMNSDKDETLPNGLVTQHKHDDVLTCTQDIHRKSRKQ